MNTPLSLERQVEIGIIRDLAVVARRMTIEPETNRKEEPQ